MRHGTRMLKFMSFSLLCIGCGVAVCCAQTPACVTNVFGICYNTETKSFTFNRAITRHLCQSVSWEIEELDEIQECRENSQYDVVGRINEKCWVVHLPAEGEDKKSLLFFITPMRKSEFADTIPCYALLDTSKSVLDAVRAEGEFLGLGYGWPQERVLFRGERISGVESLDDVWQYKCNRYVICFDGLNFITGRRFFNVDLSSEEISQLPFFVLLNVWNNHAFGAVPGKKGFSFCFYDLVTKKETSFFYLPMIGKPLWLNQEEVLITPTDGYYSPGWQCMWNPINNETFVQDAFIEQVGVVLLRRVSQEGQILLVADKSNATLWESRIDEKEYQNIERVDLNKDKAGDIEAIIIKEGEHAVLIDCLNGRSYEAEQIIHHGFGFFELNNKGQRAWVTL